jgi:hypothetical protein
MEGETLFGKVFNRINKGKLFVKLTNREENHNGFQFKTGLNVDTVPFNSLECSAGGIYFIEEKDMAAWVRYRSMNMVYYRYVSLPEDSIVYIGKCKYKADKMILSEKMGIDEQVYLEARVGCGVLLKNVRKQTRRICMAAVKLNGLQLEYVMEQTEEICIQAVKENGLALEFARRQTEVICIQAVKENGLALEFVRNQTEGICLAAVKENGNSLKYVRKQTKRICIAAVKKDNYALAYISDENIKRKCNSYMNRYALGRYIKAFLSINKLRM